MQKSIGIIGGMGSLATCDLFKKIIDMTDAKSDQEHIHICIDCNTNIPDRTKAILGGGENPIPEMVRSGIRLQSMGADVLVMPCNTAHYFYDKITPFFDIPLLNRVAFSCAPANAMDEVKEEVHYVTKKEGGKGAVRELIDIILRKKGLI